MGDEGVVLVVVVSSVGVRVGVMPILGGVDSEVEADADAVTAGTTVDDAPEPDASGVNSVNSIPRPSAVEAVPFRLRDRKDPGCVATSMRPDFHRVRVPVVVPVESGPGWSLRRVPRDFFLFELIRASRFFCS